MNDKLIYLTEDQAAQLAVRALEAARVSHANAVSVARALVAAEIDGQRGHGLSRLASYCAQARSGKVDGFAEPALSRLAPALARVDGCHGFAFPAIELAIQTIQDDARRNGIAAVAITRSHHCGQLGAHVEQLAGAGFVALMVANTPKAMAPWGGNAPLFGTNPIAFAAPAASGHKLPLVMDLSLSRVARGKVMAAAQSGESIPSDWALDDQGRPTTDPNAALAGSMVPAGEAKGAALAMMVEVMAATLTGANYSFEASSFFDADGSPPGVGQMLIAIDTQAAMAGLFAARFGELCSAIDNQPGARLPGSSREARRAQAQTRGIAVPTAQHQALEALAKA